MIRPGPFFVAGYSGTCVRGNHDTHPNQPIRDDGCGSYECRDCVEQDEDD